MSTPAPARKDRRIEIRTTAHDRELIERAAEATGTDVTGFVTEHAVVAAQNVLADRTVFYLDEDRWREWQELLDRPARDVPGLRALLQRQSPFIDE